MRNVWRSITLSLAACALTGCFTAAPIGTLYAQDLSISVTRPAVQLGSSLPLKVTGGVEPYAYEVSQGSMYGSEYLAPSTLDASLNESSVSIKVTDADGRSTKLDVWVYRPGTLDKTFGNSGIATYGTTALQKVFIDSRSRIFVKTYASSQMKIMRFNQDGSIDSNFGTSGVQVLNPGFSPSDAFVHHFHETTYGDIGVVGSVWSFSGPNHVHLAFRFLGGDSLDASYAQGAGFYSDSVNSGTVQFALRDEGNRIYLFGNTGVLSTQHRVTRIDANGNLDTSYASGGFMTFTTLGGTNNSLDGAALRSDGSLLVSGMTAGYSSVLGAIQSNGTPDPSFLPSAIVPPNMNGTSSGGKNIHLRSDGSFYWFVDDWQAGNFVHLSRRNADGSADTTFGTNGWIPRIAGTYIQTHLDTNRRLILCGMNGTGARVARILETGALDPTFAGDGNFNVTDFPHAHMFTVNDCALDPLGRILVTGIKSGQGYMIRIWN